MSPEDKKKFREAFLKSVKERPDADQCIHHRYKIRSHFLPLNWDKPCETVTEYYTKIVDSGELYDRVDKALAHIKEWKEQDAKAQADAAAKEKPANEASKKKPAARKKKPQGPKAA